MVRILLILCLLQPGLVLAKSLLAEVDRTEIQVGEILNLRILANFQTTQQPDLSSLKQDFDLLGTQAASQLQLINGQFSATTEWISQLIAKQTGEFEIPAFKIEDALSKPIKIKVTATDDKKFNSNEISYLEVYVDKENPYLQEEVILTLRVYYLGQMIKGSLSQELFEGFLNERISQDNFQSIINGKNYRVIERTYALYPQRSGEITIPTQEFIGEFFYQNRLLNINKKSEPIKLTVKPIPDSFPKNAKWLPAKNLQLQEEWANTEFLKQGDTLERQILLTARGLKSSQLPAINWPDPQGFRLYQDPANLKENFSKQGIFSSLQQNNMLVVEDEGKIEIPAIEIVWWNTETDQIESTKLPSKRLQVGEQQLTNQAETAAQTSKQPATTRSGSADNSQETSIKLLTNIWFWLAIIFAALWVLTLVLYLIKARKNPKKLIKNQQLTNQETLLTSFEIAENSTDLEFYNSINNYLKNQLEIDNFQQVKPINQELFDDLIKLEKQLFSQQKTVETKLKNSIQQQIKQLGKAIKNTQNKSTKTANKLSKLYPD